MVYEEVGFGFDISDGSTLVGLCFFGIISIRSTVQTLNDSPYVWTVRIGHCVLENIFSTFYLGLVDRLGSFTTTVNPILVILMYCSTDAISSEDFGSAVWSHPRFRFLAGFRFSNVSCWS